MGPFEDSVQNVNIQQKLLCKICILFFAVTLPGAAVTIYVAVQQRRAHHDTFKTISEKLAAWRRYRDAVRELSQLTDRELSDIGIRRGDIEIDRPPVADQAAAESGDKPRSRRAGLATAGEKAAPSGAAFCLRRSAVDASPGFVPRHAMRPIHVIGGGLAGSEAAWQAAEAGVPVVLHEMRPLRRDRRAPDEPARRTRLLQLVSLRRRARPTRSASSIARCARSVRSSCAAPTPTRCRPAARSPSTATAFRRRSRQAVLAHPLVTLERGEIAGLPPSDWDNVIVATGPLTSAALAEAIGRLTGEGALAFFDAIAPIVHRDSIDMDIAWMQSRYDKEGPSGDARGLCQLPDEPRAIRGLRRRACSPRRRPSSASSRARPISTAACRSRSWPSAAARPCATGR